MGEAEKKRERAVTRALGEAMFDAMELLVSQYLSGGGEMPEGIGAERMGAEAVNESFDESRFRTLRLSAERAAERDETSGTLPLPARSDDRAGAKSNKEQNTRSEEHFSDAGTMLHEKEARFSDAGETLRERKLRISDISARLERDARRYDGGDLFD